MSDDLRETITRTFDDEVGAFPTPAGLRARAIRHAVEGGHGRQRPRSDRGLSPGAGQRYAALVLTNRSGHPCQTFGYVGMQLLDSAGRPAPTRVTRARPPAPTVLTLAPDGSAFTVLHWTVVPGAGEPATGDCEPDPAAAQVTPPDETTQQVVAWTLGPVCQLGAVDTVALAGGAGPPG